MSAILVMAMISPRAGHGAAALAALSDHIAGDSLQPGFVWVDVFADPATVDAF